MTTSTTLLIITNVLIGSKTHQTLSLVDTTDFQVSEKSNLKVVSDIVRLKLNNIYSINHKLSNSNVPVEFASEALINSMPLTRKLKLKELVGGKMKEIVSKALIA